MANLGGVYAALLTPRDSSGELDLPCYKGQLASLGRNPLSGYAINGATGEFTICSDQELDRLLKETRQTAPAAQILCGIGAGDLRGSLHLAQLAAEAGATAALLPMPCFFPYRQDDLRSFVLAVADSAKLPILLYNLPQFTSGLNVDTTLDLLTGHDNIVGIKDSSGSLDIVHAITQAKLPVTRLIGNDGALAEALSENLCDGVVSGVACVLPELMLALYKSGCNVELEATSKQLLNEFITALNILPTPWGLKAASAVRGFTNLSFPFPLSEERKADVERLQSWFQDWHNKTLLQNAGNG